MFNVVQFRKEDLLSIIDQKENAHLKGFFFRNGLAEKLEKECAYTGFVNKEIMICGGISEIWPGRGLVWAVFNEKSKQNFLPVFRGIREWCRTQPYRRLELSVTDCNERGMQRAQLLGFTLETPRARGYLPDGRDAALFSLVKDDSMVNHVL